MFDPGSIVVGGVGLMILIFGLVEFFKEVFSLSGRGVTILAACLGAVLYALYQVNGFIPAPYNQIYPIVITSLAVGMAASGYYKFTASRMPKFE